MTLTEISSRIVPSIPSPSAGFLRAAWAGYRAHLEEQRLIRRLARMPARLLVDMGFDPDAIYAAGGAAWDNPFTDPKGGANRR